MQKKVQLNDVLVRHYFLYVNNKYRMLLIWANKINMVTLMATIEAQKVRVVKNEG